MTLPESSSHRLRRRPPLPLLVAAVFGVGVFLVPLVGLLSRTPWTRLGGLLESAMAREAMMLSLLTSLAATVISVILGVPLAWLLARVEFAGRSVIRGLVILPMVLPPVVGGAALLFALGRRGLLGEPLYLATGFSLPFSIWGVVAANTFVALPFLVLTLDGALGGLDRRFEQAAASLGAGPFTVFRRVTMPLVRPSLLAGTVLAWARALGEFGATITFAGNLPGRTQTLPLAVFIALESDPDAAVALSLVLVAVSLVVIIGLRGRWWRVT
ncbi:MAG TPA: ABC transporter permease [Acidimicrobiia bacterium]|nr:ABC transporter permease [Acidimicrobiia bacterium]